MDNFRFICNAEAGNAFREKKKSICTVFQFNNSNTGLFTIHTGKDDIRNVHKVESWNGLTEVTQHIKSPKQVHFFLFDSLRRP